MMAPSETEPTSANTSGGGTIFAALERQLGLRLEPNKRPIDIFVIDHVEKLPVEN